MASGGNKTNTVTDVSAQYYLLSLFFGRKTDNGALWADQFPAASPALTPMEYVEFL